MLNESVMKQDTEISGNAPGCVVSLFWNTVVFFTLDVTSVLHLTTNSEWSGSYEREATAPATIAESRSMFIFSTLLQASCKIEYIPSAR